LLTVTNKVENKQAFPNIIQYNIKLQYTVCYLLSPYSTISNYSTRYVIFSRHTVVAEDTTRGMLSHLHVYPAQREDTGQYTCNAANRFASDFTTIYLTVLGKWMVY